MVDPQFFCRHERMLRGRPLPHKVPSCLVRSVWQVTGGGREEQADSALLVAWAPDRQREGAQRVHRGSSKQLFGSDHLLGALLLPMARPERAR